MLMHNAIINYCSIVLFIICGNKAEIKTKNNHLFCMSLPDHLYW